MSNFVLLWLIFAGVVTLEAVFWHCLLSAVGGKRSILDEHAYDGPPDPAPRVSLIVAARNEERNIESCVVGLLNQDYPDQEVIAVDDRSTDRTGAILRRLKSEYGDQLTVITIQKLAEGWFGKNNAMREGVARSTGEWLCFTDADCTFTSPKTVSLSMREAHAHHADFLTLLPILDQQKTWERVLQPACAIMMMAWFQPMRVNNPACKVGYANGQFMLMSRGCYEGMGGHERVRTELNEDVVFGRLCKHEGFKLRVVEGVGLTLCRMYESVTAAWNGWSRIFHGSVPSTVQLAGAALWHILFAVAPWICLGVALAGLLLSGPRSALPWGSLAVAWGIGVFVHQTVLWRLYKMMYLQPRWSLTHALGATMLIGMLLNAVTKSLGLTSTTWRGVTYRNKKLERDAEAPQPERPARPEVILPTDDVAA